MTTRLPTAPGEPAAAGHALAPVPPRRSRYRVLLAVLLAVFVMPAAVVLAGLKTEVGARILWKAATGAMAGKLAGEIVSGTLADGVSLKDFRYNDALHAVRIDRLSGAWHFSPSPPTLVIDILRLGQADLRLLPSAPKPATLPKEIRLPLAIDLKNLRVGKVILHQGTGAAEYSDIRASATTDRLHHQVRLEHVSTPFGELQAGVRLGGVAPFPLDGTVNLESVVDQQRYGVAATLGGSLQALAVKVRASGGKLDGSADIAATPFGAVPFQTARIAVTHLDPKVFAPAAPHADLSVQATLSPVAASVRAGDLSGIAVTGPIVVSNAEAGPADKGLLPLVSAQAQAMVTATRQALSQVTVRLPGNATATGTAALHDTAQGELDLQVANLDLQALYTTLAPTRLSGPLSVTLDKGAQTIRTRLASTALSISADARLEPQRILLNSASLQAGASQVNVTGSLGRDAQSSFAVKGVLKDFDPAVVLAQVRPPTAGTAAAARTAKHPRTTAGATSATAATASVKNVGTPVHARINMDVDADGALKPTLGARVHFAIHDSVYNQLPMTGGGAVDLLGQRLRSSDATLSIAGNDAAIKGSFGAPSDRLDFRINAPALDRLGFGIAGAMQADGRIAGTISHPLIDARYGARGLALGTNRLAKLAGEAHIDGVPGQNPNARLMVTANAEGIRGGPADLERLNARVNGTYAVHTIDLSAAGKLGGQPLELSFAAQGNLKERGASYAWDGIVKTLENRGVPRVSIGAPLKVSATPGQVELGRTRLSIGPAQIDLGGLEYRPGLIRSQGGFNALRVADLLELRQKITGAPAPVNTTLVLDGAWDFSLSDTARGFIQISRRGGDVIAATPNGSSALGLNVLSLRGDFRGDRLQFDSRVEATRLGTLAARGTLGLVRQDNQLTISPDSTLAGTLDAALPKLRDLGALTGPSVALDGSMLAKLSAAGTLGKPGLSGTLSGDGLALTLFDQGIKLRDGRARIALDNNFVDLREVVFHGGSGTLKATGRIPLDQANTSLAATITAERLQLLADPAKQLTLSGKATIANVDQRLRVDGRFVVDHALFSVPDKTAPKLGDDVVIVHEGAPRKPVAPKPGVDAPPTPAPTGLLPPEIRVTVDLGNSFRFKGAGADLMLAGAIDVRSGPKLVPQATGTVRVASGKFEAFGANLTIERGLITFQGPLGNPSINILAMRRNQDVPAGVQVTGTVEQPRVVLVSEPNLAEEEKLSWLVFGHAATGSTASTGQAQSAVQSAALGLLNKAGGDPLAKSIGLDQLSIGSSSYGANPGQVVNLGKEISDRLNIAYEQGLAGAASVVKLTYVLSQHWSLVARGGAVAGLDVLYSRRFDRLRAGAEKTSQR